MSSLASNSAAEAAGKSPVLSYATPAKKVSDWSPLRNPIFRAMWAASAVSYIGFEIRNYAAPLLMIDFKKFFGVSDGMAAFTLTASTLPIPLLVLLAGALADVLDRRKLLIVTHLWMMGAAGALGLLTICHLMTPWVMLGFLFILGAGYAMANPAFLAVLPELVEPAELRSALALNSVNMNIARVLGPAIGGLVVVLMGKQNPWLGKGAAFLATGLSVIGVVAVLVRWKPVERKKPAHPETVGSAIRTGLRYTRFSPRLLAIMGRMVLFLLFASILPTFCSIICKKNPVTMRGDSGAAIVMAFFGVGAIVGVYLMQALQRRFGTEETVTVCTLTYGAAMLAVASTHSLILVSLAMFVAGFNWVIVPTNFNIATQLAVPAWIKGRAMGVYSLVLWGSFAAGSALFGSLTSGYARSHPGLPADSAARHALVYAGFGVLAGAIGILWLRLVSRSPEDYAPAKQDFPGDAGGQAEFLSGPVWVGVEYRVSAKRAEEFRALMHELRRQRLRNGASDWHLQTAGDVCTEHFLFSSWRARLRHHERTTKSDAALEKNVRALQEVDQDPIIRYSKTPPAGVAQDCCAWRSEISAGMGRALVQLFERLDRARERDQYRKPWKRPGE